MLGFKENQFGGNDDAQDKGGKDLRQFAANSPKMEAKMFWPLLDALQMEDHALFSLFHAPRWHFLIGLARIKTN